MGKYSGFLMKIPTHQAGYHVIARGSNYETKTHLTIAKDRCLFSQGKRTELFEMSEELLKILNVYIKATGPKQ